MGNDELEAYGLLVTRLTRGQLGAQLAGKGIEVLPARYVLRLRVEGERVELQPVSEGYLVSSNNDGAAWIAALRRLSKVLGELGVRHRIEVMDGDAIVETFGCDGAESPLEE